jgi:hypothetical protein
MFYGAGAEKAILRSLKKAEARTFDTGIQLLEIFP